MTRGRRPERVLRWYPAAWRRRYGADLALLWAGTAERLRESGLRGSAGWPSASRS